MVVMVDSGGGGGGRGGAGGGGGGGSGGVGSGAGGEGGAQDVLMVMASVVLLSAPMATTALVAISTAAVLAAVTLGCKPAGLLPIQAEQSTLT
jgi:hypothetical protein